MERTDEKQLDQQQIRERAWQLWEAEGRPEGRALDHWLLAEREWLTQSVAGEEDPFVGLDHEPPGALAPGVHRSSTD